MKRLAVILLIASNLIIISWFISLLRQGSDGAWLALGVLSTLAMYLIFSAVEMAKDRLRSRWLNQDSQAGYYRRQFSDLTALGRAQGQFLVNQQRLGRLGSPAAPDDLFNYDDALVGDILDLPAYTPDNEQSSPLNPPAQY